ncbi:hypothetical protein BDV97DRAFT_419126 [Delphinella strobiligena]|nr:hypothetical protein BDV97DRAFT_419126 [Delphinella strobiligena]
MIALDSASDSGSEGSPLATQQQQHGSAPDRQPQSHQPDDTSSKGGESQDPNRPDPNEKPNESIPDEAAESERHEARLAEHRKKIRSTKLNIKEREKALRKQMKKARKSRTAPSPPSLGSWLGTWTLYTAGPNNKSGKYNTHLLTLMSCLHDPSSETIDTDRVELCLRCQRGHESGHARGIVSLDNGNQRFELLCFQAPDHASLDAIDVPLKMCGEDGGKDEFMTMSIVFVGRRRMRVNITKSCLPDVEDVGEMRFVGAWVE